MINMLMIVMKIILMLMINQYHLFKMMIETSAVAHIKISRIKINNRVKNKKLNRKSKDPPLSKILVEVTLFSKLFSEKSENNI